MDELPTWLRAQIAEKRARAEAASPGPWHANAEQDEVLAVDGIVVCEGFALSNNQLRATVDFIADNDPAAVLAQCEAHEKVLRPHNIVHDDEFGLYCIGCGYNALERPNTRGSLDRCPVWRGIALAFQQLPGYREEWRP